MPSRYEKVLSNHNLNRPKGLSSERPIRTKPGDHLSWLVARARDGKWDDLVEYINSDEPLTPQGRAAIALLVKQLLERRHGGPSGTPTDDDEAKQVAVWFMCAARELFFEKSGRTRLRHGEIERLAEDTAAKINPEYAKLASPITASDLIGSENDEKKSPYEVGPTNHAEYLVVHEMRHCAKPIVNELVEALIAYEKSNPVNR